MLIFGQLEIFRKIQGNLQDFGALVDGQDGNGRTTWHDTEKVVPAANDTTTMLLNEVLERNTHLLLYDARVVDVAANAEQLGALITGTTETCEPWSTATANGWGDSDSLNVGDGGRAAEETNVGGEWRLQTRLALLALQTLDERSLLSTHVRTRPAMDIHVKVVSGPARVLADEPGLVGLVDGLLEVPGLEEKLAADVDVGCVGVHGASGDEAALDELVRVASEDLAVFARPWLAFVGVDDEVSGSSVFFPARLVHE